ncbi:hypothetical protein DFH07DRAFT_969314 [Mycena maculata]|uniref:Uncharacterized protein n=1 Tax=Mycena maculata TaxID=230809 RepID=A0AAD7MTJ0_9AGAR|nr:hypothetical protein DFH07DRAFT_969314 [Mycena maculata]
MNNQGNMSSQPRAQSKTPPRTTAPIKTATRIGLRSTPDLAANAHKGLSREDLYKKSEVDWKAQGQDGAKAWLVANTFISGDCDPELTLPNLALILLRVAATGTSSDISQDALRAVATILDNKRSDIEYEIIDRLDTMVTDVIKTLAFAEAGGAAPREGEGYSSLVDELRTAAEMLKCTVEEQRNGVEEVMVRVEASPIAVPQVSASILKGAVPGHEGRSYAGVAAGGVSATVQHAAAVASAQAWERQVMVDRSPLVEAYGLAKLMEKELVVKGNIALVGAITFLGDNTVLQGAAFVGAQQVRSGAVLFHLNSVSAADWIRAPQRMAAFLSELGGTAVYKPRLYSVVVEFVPTTFNPGLENTFHVIEDTNSIDRGELVQARYIKAPERRYAG